jgi:hypothetical protein
LESASFGAHDEPAALTGRTLQASFDLETASFGAHDEPAALTGRTFDY